MPSRPVTARAGRARPQGMVNNVRVAIDVRQPANTFRAKGTFRIADTRTGEVMEATEFGPLQTADRWAAFTTRLRLSSSPAEQWAVVIVDRGDPAAPGTTHVSVLVDGRERTSAVLQ